MSNDKNISATASNCGENPPTKKKNWFIRHWIWTSIGVLTLFSIIGNSSNISSTTSGESSVSKSEETEQKPEKLPPLQLNAWNWKVEHGYITVTGEVENLSDKPIKSLMAMAKFYDADGNFVKSSDGMVEYQPLLAGQSSPFRAMSTHNPAIKEVKLEFKKMFGGQVKFKERE